MALAMKVKPKWQLLAFWSLAVGGLWVYVEMTSDTTYEFQSCAPGSDLIIVKRVPSGYQPRHVTARIRDDQPIGWTEGEPNAPSRAIYNTGFDNPVLYVTYPDYQPLGKTSWRKFSRMEYDSKDSLTLLFATIEFSPGRTVDVVNPYFIHEQNGTRKYPVQRVREDSVDGKYWVYTQPEQRAKFPYSVAGVKPSEPTYFMPKDMGVHVLIA